MSRPAFFLCLSAIAASLCFPTGAQADDWDFDDVPSQKLKVASLAYDTGLTIMVACQDGRFSVVLSGLSRATSVERTIQHQFADKPEARAKWLVYGDGSIAHATGPTAMSRDLMAGGTVKFSVPSKDGSPAKVYILNLPENSEAVGQVMTACGRALERSVPEGYPDTELAFNPRWTTRPNPNSLPFEVNGPVNVYISCQTGPRGRVQNCYVDSAHPWKERVNEYLLRHAQRGVLVDGNSGEPYPSGLEFLFEVRIT